MSLYKRLPRLQKKKALLTAPLPFERLLRYFLNNKMSFIIGFGSLMIFVTLTGFGSHYWKEFQTKKVANEYRAILLEHSEGLEALSNKNWEASAKIFEKASLQKNNPVKDYSQLYLGMSFEKMGKTEEALKAYDSISEEGESNTVRKLASEKSVWLKAGL